MFYCRVCGQPTTNHSWPWEVCSQCEPFQQAVSALAEHYQGKISAMALSALDASLHIYDDRTGERVTDKKAQRLRKAMVHSREHRFYDAFKLPSLHYAHAASISRFVLDLILSSSLLPAQLNEDIRKYLAEVDSQQKQCSHVLTSFSNGRWHAQLAERKSGSDWLEEATAFTEAEAIEKLLRLSPECREQIAMDERF